MEGGAILPLSRHQNSFVDTGHIYLYVLMKFCMVDCINILHLAKKFFSLKILTTGTSVMTS